MPATLSPDVGDVTTPDLVRRINREPAIEMVRNVDPLYRGLLVRVTPGLLADQSQFLHQATDLEAANHRTFLAHHAHDAAAAGRAAALDEQVMHATAQRHTLDINTLGALPVCIQAGP